MKQSLFLATLLILLITSCHRPPSDPVRGYAGSDIVAHINAQRCQATQLSASMDLTLNAAGHNITVGGSLKMKRNDCIQMSLQVLGLVEAGRLELTPDYILLVNRIGKQYVQVAYDDIAFFREGGINFYTFQSLFWNELFLPGTGNAAPSAAGFTMSQGGTGAFLTHTARSFVLRFLANTTTGLLQQTTIKGNDGEGTLDWNYRSWERLDKSSFPDKMDLSLVFHGFEVSMNWQLRNLRSNERWNDTRTKINTDKYKKVTPEQILKQLGSL
ncbi:MAG: DUF4292 domain-containing protein [Bacteroidales bacterium]|nr:DUF4292 domain-containing protein [Candidatus Physcousia equi]